MKKALLLATLFCAQSVFADLTIYTDRVTANLQPIANEFTARTGEKVTIVELAYPALKARIEAEKENSPADLIFVKDLIYLNEMADQGFFKAFTSEKVTASVPEQMRNSQNLWTAVSFRVRSLIYNSTIVNPSDIQSYTDLASDFWAGRVCVRSGSHAYNQALVSGFVHNLGAEKTTDFLNGLLANLAVDPMANDRAVIDSVASGVCDIGIVNHYYLAPYVAANPAFVVKMAFLNQGSTGVHTNGSGIGIFKLSKNQASAEKFMELLFEDQVQLQWSSSHYDYPAKTNLIPSTLIKDWGLFKTEQASWETLGKSLPAALQIIKDVEYK